MTRNEELARELERWAEIAEQVHQKGYLDGNNSLLHSFPDRLAYDLRQAVTAVRKADKQAMYLPEPMPVVAPATKHKQYDSTAQFMLDRSKNIRCLQKGSTTARVAEPPTPQRISWWSWLFGE